MRSRSIPFWISLVIHGLVLGGATLFFVQPPQFAMDAGKSSIEVNLVAAASDPVPPPPPLAPDQMLAETRPPQPDDVLVPDKPTDTPPPPPTPPPPVPPPPAPPLLVQKPKSPHKPTVAKGDDSAPKPGKDATTASSDGGAIIDTKPDYLSNPPPVYPDLSRREKQEGLVVLQVIVSTEGRPESVDLQGSSGYALLDQEAIRAVKGWRFRPASLGSMSVRSRVMVPVRFRLGN